MFRKMFPLSLALAVCLSISGTAKADAVNLGAAGNFSVLAFTDLTLNTFTVNGNVGIGGGGHTLQKGTITGNLVIDPNATATADLSKLNNDFFVTGSINNPSSLATAISNAISASQFAAGLASTSLANIENGNITSLTGGGVYQLAHIDLNGQSETLTLHGNASDVFIFNITDYLQVSQSSILLDGVSAANVLFNITATNASKESTIQTSDSVVFGTVLIPYESIVLLDAGVNGVGTGGVYGHLIGNDITIHSGGLVDTPTAAPEPASMLLFGTGLTALGAFARRRHRRKVS